MESKTPLKDDFPVAALFLGGHFDNYDCSASFVGKCERTISHNGSNYTFKFFGDDDLVTAFNDLFKREIQQPGGIAGIEGEIYFFTDGDNLTPWSFNVMDVIAIDSGYQITAKGKEESGLRRGRRRASRGGCRGCE